MKKIEMVNKRDNQPVLVQWLTYEERDEAIKDIDDP